jgi:Tfp pilus assembly protein PilV
MPSKWGELLRELKTMREFTMRKRLSDESGLTLVESLIALVILLGGLLSMAQFLTFSIVASKTHGRDAAKATAYAHDKMEELTGLQFTDTTTNITVNAPFPATGGVGLTQGGTVPPAAAAAGYVDYLDVSGVRTTSGNAAYTRQWQIINDSADLKRIIVTVTSDRSFLMGARPSTTIVTEKTP